MFSDGQKERLPQPPRRLTSPPSSGSCSPPSYTRAISPGRPRRLCPIGVGWRARMLCHLRDGCVGSLQSSVSDLGDVPSRPKGCQCPAWLQDESSKAPSLPAHTPQGKHWRRKDPSIERTVSAHKPVCREDIDYI